MKPRPLAIVVVGASGDLARRKILPALFSLFARGLLPPEFGVFGFARSAMDSVTFRAGLSSALTCRYTPAADCGERQQAFLEHCHYIRGEYDDPSAFLDLYRMVRETLPGNSPDILYYLAVPPSIFLDCARALGDCGMVQCGEAEPWTRVVVEKPFGHDRESSDQLVTGLAHVFSESDTYRIDHYLGKEVIQNLLVLRFANRVFEPLWNHESIERIEVDWRETFGVEGRGAYFDRYGILRDVVQNHLLQILALVAMERPLQRTPDAVRDAKVNLLRAIRPPGFADVRLGQYVAGSQSGMSRPGYRGEKGVPPDSCTATYARLRLFVRTPRWYGVPFDISAGKAMDSDRTEIRIVFRESARPWIEGLPTREPSNSLVIRVQPQEAIRLRVLTKEPGLELRAARTDLQLVYGDAFSQTIPEAYERLLLDVVHGDKSLFISKDELAASWDVFTPLLHAIDQSQTVPESYPFGSSDLPEIADDRKAGNA